MQTDNRQFLLAERPNGAPTVETFNMITTTIPEPGEGELRIRTIYLSLDPYMRGRMNAGRSYAEPVAVGAVMEGGTVGVVEASRHAGFADGDLVVGRTGWQDYALSDGEGLR